MFLASRTCPRTGRWRPTPAPPYSPPSSGRSLPEFNNYTIPPIPTLLADSGAESANLAPPAAASEQIPVPTVLTHGWPAPVSAAARKQKIARLKAKRKRRIWAKRGYGANVKRKAVAAKRQRVEGRFQSSAVWVSCS